MGHFIGLIHIKPFELYKIISSTTAFFCLPSIECNKMGIGFHIILLGKDHPHGVEKFPEGVLHF